MKFHFFLFFILSQVMSYAQITVSNSSYIYIDSTFVYAALPIDLKAVDSHIYLRNKGQLLQNGNFINSGLGSLSVYQTGNVNEYAYNYWCSPVGNNHIDSSVNNVFTPTLLGDPNSSETIIDYKPATFTSSYEGSSNPLTISKRWIYTYDSGGNSSFGWNHIGDVGEINPGLGFTMKGTTGSNNSQVYEFRGKPNTGDISNIVMEGESILIGNPYPSGFDAFLFIHDPENVKAIDGTLSFWEQDLNVLSHYSADYVGGYATYTITSDGGLETFVPAPFSTYNNDGTINTSGNGIGSKIASQYLSIGQGFMVNGKVGTSGIVKTKNSHRVYANNIEATNHFFKNTNNQKDVSSEYMQFRINIDFDDMYTRQLIHNFNKNATDGFDYGMESINQNELSNDAYWVQGNQFYVAKASIFNKNLIIPIVINLESDAKLGFRLFDVQNFKNQQNVYLFDNETNSYYNLSSENASLNLTSGNYPNRFDIRFQNKTLLIKDKIKNELGLTAFFEVENSNINITNKSSIMINTVFLYNVNGKKVLNSNLMTQDKFINIPVHPLSQGVYFLKCFTDKRIENFKLIVK